jgi:uncharacterized protein (DUF849 family)
MLLQATLNGPWTRADHPALPVSSAELARDAAACVAAGAGALHLHPRDADDNERLDGAVVDAVVRELRAAVGSVAIGVSTGEWIEPDLERRVALVRGWSAPDMASVNLGEPGADAVMAALLAAGVAIEAGVACVADAERLAATGLGARIARVLVEPVDAPADPPAARAPVADIHRALDDLGLAAPRLQHGDGAATWPLLADAVARGIDARIGLEDTLRGSDGALAEGNVALVHAARALGAGAGA